jgi:lipid-A-disaccharide synthase
MKLDLFIIAGEASADAHAAALLREIKSFFPDVSAYGVGGTCLKEEGMELLISASALNIVGLTEAVEKFMDVWRSYRTLTKTLKKRRASCAILLDLPDFNLIMARKLKRLGIPVIYYISPQIWAWRTYRVKKIKRLVDKMLVLFPFERTFYENYGVPVDFVGHPLLDSLSPRVKVRNQSEVLRAPRIALLPGSRTSEIRNHCPVLLETVNLLRKKFPHSEFRLPIASTLEGTKISPFFGGASISLEQGNAREVLNWADVALVASGTATLETSLIGTPFCLFYRLSNLSYRLLRFFFSYRGFAGLPNLLLGSEVVREFIQESATPQALADETCQLLENEALRDAQRARLFECRIKLGQSGASQRAAQSVKAFLEKGYETLSRPLISSPV